MLLVEKTGGRRMRLLVAAMLVALALAVAPVAAAWTWPLDGELLQAFSAGPDPYAAGQHRGIDIGGSPGEAIRATATGTVTFAGTVPTHGRALTITTAAGL